MILFGKIENFEQIRQLRKAGFEVFGKSAYGIPTLIMREYK